MCRDRGEKHGLTTLYPTLPISIMLQRAAGGYIFFAFFWRFGNFVTTRFEYLQQGYSKFSFPFQESAGGNVCPGSHFFLLPSTKLHPQCHRLLCTATAFVYLSISMHLSKVLMATFLYCSLISLLLASLFVLFSEDAFSLPGKIT